MGLKKILGFADENALGLEQFLGFANENVLGLEISWGFLIAPQIGGLSRARQRAGFFEPSPGFETEFYHLGYLKKIIKGP